MPASDWTSVYGISSQGASLTLDYEVRDKHGNVANVGSRNYLVGDNMHAHTNTSLCANNLILVSVIPSRNCLIVQMDGDDKYKMFKLKNRQANYVQLACSLCFNSS